MDEGVGKATHTRIQAANRSAILAAGLEIFATYGFRGATVDRIAQAAGMSKPNLLYYFRRKEDVYRAVLEETLDNWLAPLEDLDPEGEPLAELERYVRAKLAMSRATPQASRLFAGEILGGAPVIEPILSGRLRALVDEKSDVIKRWIEAGRLTPVDPHHLLFAIWATTQHYADFDVQIQAVLGDRANAPAFADEVARSVLTIVLGGLKPR